MKKRLSIVSIALAMFLGGCSANIATTVKMSELLDNKSKQLNGELYIEVSSCNNFEDSRKESENLIKTRKAILNGFTDSKYNQCFKKSFTSYAMFNVPVQLAHDKNSISSKYINLITDRNYLLSLNIPKDLQKNIYRIQKDNITKSKINVGIKVINDIKDVPFTALSVFIDDVPFIAKQLTSHKNTSFIMKLSDVSVQTALKEDLAIILLRQ